MMRDKMNTQLRKFNETGQDVTDTGDYKDAKRVIEEHELMTSELGLSADASQEEIDQAKADKAIAERDEREAEEQRQREEDIRAQEEMESLAGGGQPTTPNTQPTY